MFTLAEVEIGIKQALAIKGENYVYDEQSYEWYDDEGNVTYVSRDVMIDRIDGDFDIDDYDAVCVYYRDGRPSCLVAHVYDYLGVDPADVEENTSAASQTKVPMEPAAVRLLRDAQFGQDTGHTWGQSVRDAYMHKANYPGES